MSNVSLMVCVFSEKKKKGKHEVPEPYRDNSNTEVVGSSSCTEYSCAVVAVLGSRTNQSRIDPAGVPHRHGAALRRWSLLTDPPHSLYQTTRGLPASPGSADKGGGGGGESGER